jgi:hypothetical protein
MDGRVVPSDVVRRRRSRISELCCIGHPCPLWNFGEVLRSGFHGIVCKVLPWDKGMSVYRQDTRRHGAVPTLCNQRRRWTQHPALPRVAQRYWIQGTSLAWSSAPVHNEFKERPSLDRAFLFTMNSTHWVRLISHLLALLLTIWFFCAWSVGVPFIVSLTTATVTACARGFWFCAGYRYCARGNNKICAASDNSVPTPQKTRRFNYKYQHLNAVLSGTKWRYHGIYWHCRNCNTFPVNKRTFTAVLKTHTTPHCIHKTLRKQPTDKESGSFLNDLCIYISALVPRVIRSKTYRGYVKPQIILNVIYSITWNPCNIHK